MPPTRPPACLAGCSEAQKNLFGHTTAGDLRPYLSGFFDTTSGAKVGLPIRHWQQQLHLQPLFMATPCRTEDWMPTFISWLARSEVVLGSSVSLLPKTVPCRGLPPRTAAHAPSALQPLLRCHV